MVEPRRAGRRRRAAQALPGVQPDVMVISARRDEGRALAEALGQLEAEHAAIESQRPLDLRDLEVYVADANLGIDGFTHDHEHTSRPWDTLLSHLDSGSWRF